jgi:hypothetical protein
MKGVRERKDIAIGLHPSREKEEKNERVETDHLPRIRGVLLNSQCCE